MNSTLHLGPRVSLVGSRVRLAGLCVCLRGCVCVCVCVHVCVRYMSNERSSMIEHDLRHFTRLFYLSTGVLWDNIAINKDL